MAVSKVLTMFVIALSFVAIASSLSAEEFLNQISTGENNPKIDIQKIASTAKVPEQHISPETKQIAYAEILQKLKEQLPTEDQSFVDSEIEKLATTVDALEQKCGKKEQCAAGICGGCLFPS